MAGSVSSDQLEPPICNNLWLDSVAAAFDVNRRNRINCLGTLMFNVECAVEGFDVIFRWGKPGRFLRLLVFKHGGASLEAWEGARKTIRRSLLERRTFELPDDAQQVALAFEKSAALAAAFTDWARYPILSRQILLEWRRVATL